MAAPEYVPVPPAVKPRAYESPEHVPEEWNADRPADLDAGQPTGPLLGHQGPDQGYALHLVRRFDDRLRLQAEEHHDDVVAGGVGVALKRASLFGRAPVIHDLDVAFTVWGYLDDSPDPELVALRRRLFEGVASFHHYWELRELVDRVPDEVLRLAPAAVRERHAAGWRPLVGE